MIDLGIKHHFSKGVYAKEAHIAAGLWAEQHKHTYEHMSILASGIVAVEVNGETTIYVAPAVITIAAETVHKVTALKNAVWFCVHATEETDPEKVDEVLICRGE
jgi:quercetin dioxygenase-like cupin family protein